MPDEGLLLNKHFLVLIKYKFVYINLIAEHIRV